MCDTIVVAPSRGPVWIAKNSDREPSEAQAVERVRGQAAGDGRRRCTHVTVDVPAVAHAMVIGRPAWMWGAEMGINERGVAIANEAVFTREPVADTGLTGMDLLRLALEQADTAEAALEVICAHAGDQGGRMGHRHRGFRYHSSFAIADRHEAWILETAGRFWAAKRVLGIATMSNVLSIGRDFDRIHPDAADHARTNGYPGASDGDFDFAGAFADPKLAIATGGEARRACTRDALPRDAAAIDAPALAAALQSHGGHHPADGWRMQMPCAHASWLPTRTAGQTTGSMIARLDDAPHGWWTGTSSPCLSVFKPVALGGDPLPDLARAPETHDDTSLWWRHERLHRRVLADYEPRALSFAAARQVLQERAWDRPDAWTEHAAAIDDWTAIARSVGRARRHPFAAFWRWQSVRDGLPG